MIPVAFVSAAIAYAAAQCINNTIREIEGSPLAVPPPADPIPIPAPVSQQGALELDPEDTQQPWCDGCQAQHEPGTTWDCPRWTNAIDQGTQTGPDNGRNTIRARVTYEIPEFCEICNHPHSPGSSLLCRNPDPHKRDVAAQIYWCAGCGIPHPGINAWISYTDGREKRYPHWAWPENDEHEAIKRQYAGTQRRIGEVNHENYELRERIKDLERYANSLESANQRILMEIEDLRRCSVSWKQADEVVNSISTEPEKVRYIVVERTWRDSTLPADGYPYITEKELNSVDLGDSDNSWSRIIQNRNNNFRGTP